MSSVYLSKHYIVLGTHQGTVMVWDHDQVLVKKWRAHGATVNAVTMDEKEEMVGTAGHDGRVCLLPLSAKEEAHGHDLKRPILALALEPRYADLGTKRFVCGGMGGNLVMMEKGWLGNKETKIFGGEGPIRAVEWWERLVAWVSDAGVRVYDVQTSQRIAFVRYPQSSPSPALIRPSLFFSPSLNGRPTLLIGWGSLLSLLSVKPHSEAAHGAFNLANLPGVSLMKEEKLVFDVPAVSLEFDWEILGVRPYGTEGFLILGYPTEEEEGEKRPSLLVVSNEGEELSADELELAHADKFKTWDYRFCSIDRPPVSTTTTGNATHDDDGWYVMSPEDLVLVKRRDPSDRVEWLTSVGRYEEALELLDGPKGFVDLGVNGSMGTVKGDRKAIGKKWMASLLEKGEYEKAAQEGREFVDGKDEWEAWVWAFVERGQLKVIIPFVPTTEPKLEATVYEMILASFLKSSPAKLLETIKEWPGDIYSTSSVLLAVQDRIDRTDRTVPEYDILLSCALELLLHSEQYAKAIPYFLKLRKLEVFEFIKQHQLWDQMKENDGIKELVLFERSVKGESGEEEAMRLFVEHTNEIPIDRVVQQLASERKDLFKYLDGVFEKDPHLAFAYADLQVELYTEFGSNKLMHFLRSNSYYSLEKAYNVCQKYDLIPEVIFLLGRMGNNKKALMIIIERLADVDRAIEFAKEQNDAELWQDLLKYSETRPTFIKKLLETVGGEIDPILLIRRIQNGLEIPGLKASLIKILQDFTLQMSLLEGCKSVLSNDSRQLQLKLHSGQTNGFHCHSETLCKNCSKSLFAPPEDACLPGLGIVFLCRHAFHARCVFPHDHASTDAKETTVPNLAERQIDRMKGGGTGSTNLSLKLAATLKSQYVDIACPYCLKGGATGAGVGVG
ncbi:ARM repeat-containing protein [Atractiella rhizophila]|nr:ARM repeat-containing protein [Atractiella rhizophila]